MKSAKSCTLWVLSLLLLASTAGSEEATVPKTVDEARKLRAQVLRHANQPAKVTDQTRAPWADPIFKFLESDNAEIRRIALETLPQFYAFRKEACLPYLEDQRLSYLERRTLLWLSLLGWATEPATREKVNGLVKTTIDSATCPAAFNMFLQAISGIIGPPQPTDAWVDDAHKEVFARRVLASLSRVVSEDCKLFPQHEEIYRGPPVRLRAAFEIVLRLGEKSAGEAISAWYVVEPDPVARAVVVSEDLSWAKSPEWQARRKAVLELAAKDWDREIAAKAKKLLGQGE